MNINNNKSNKGFLLLVGLGTFIVGVFVILFYLSFYSIGVAKIVILGPVSENTQPFKQFIKNPKAVSEWYQNSGVDTLNITLSSEDWVKLNSERTQIVNNYLKTGGLNESENTWYNTTFKYKGNKSSGKLKLTGLWSDHWFNPNIFSFKIKVKNDAIDQQRKMNILKYPTRKFQIDYVANQIYNKYDGGLSYNYHPIFVIINKKTFGSMLVEGSTDKHLIENSRARESYIIQVIEKDSIIYRYTPKGKSEAITAGWKDENLFPLIDKNKFLRALSFSFINNNVHNLSYNNFKLYWNPATGLLEPLIREIDFTTIKEDELKLFDGDIWFQSDRFIVGNNQSKALAFDPGFSFNYVQWLIDNNKLTKDEVRNSLIETIKYYEVELNSDEYKNFMLKVGPSNWAGAKEAERLLLANINAIKNKLDTDKIIVQNEEITNYYITKDTTINTDLLINKNQHLVINKGANITLANGADILVYGKITSSGTTEQPININGDSSGNSFFIHTKQDCSFTNTHFKNLSSLSKNLWKTPASITAYETPIKFNYCSFEGNLVGDDFLNLFRCEGFEIKNSTFNNILSDAFDSDFSNGLVEGCLFTNVGNDGVDGSGSNISVINCTFNTIADKAISAGEKSHFIAKNVTVTNSAIVFVSKDQSLLEVGKFKINDNQLDFCVFQKKPEFGAGQLITSVSIAQYKYLVQKKSVIKSNDTALEYVKDVEALLYGNIYGKATQK